MTRKVVAGAAALALVASNVAIIPAASAATFSDVSMDAWYYDYVLDLTDMGIVSGNPDGTFRPDDSLNRAEMAKIAVNVAMKSGVITSEDMSGAPTFLDVDADQWFYSFVSLAAKNQILEGYRDANGALLGVYGPGNTVNRAEASKVLLLAAGVPEMLTPGAPFMDVASTDWFYAYVTSAYNWSILDGYKTVDGKLTGYFGPGDAVTRAQISKIAVLAQDPVDRYTGEHLNDMPTNGNTNNNNTNTGTGSNMNTNGVATSDVAFEAKVSASSPARADLALGTAFNTIGIFDFTAGTEEDVKITELTILNRGFISDSLVAGVLVVDEMGERHGNFVNFSESKAIVNFASDPIIVKAGTTAKVMIQMNFDRGTGNESGTVGVELPVSGIKATGVSTGGMVNVMGSGLMSAIHALFSGANVGTVQITNGNIYGNQTLDLGAMDQNISSFKLTAGSEEDISLYEWTFYNNGTAADGDVKNLDLVDQDGMVLSTVEMSENRYATFNLSANPYIIPKGTSRTFTIRGDIMDGSTRTVRFVMNDDYDIKVKGQTTQAFLLPSVTTAPMTMFPVGDGVNLVTINEGDLTLSKATSSPSGEIANGVTETVIAEFNAQAFGEDIEIQAGTITLDWNDVAPTNGVLSGTVRLMNGSGATIHSVAATEFADNVDEVFARFNSTYTVKAGTTDKLRIVVDIAEAATTSDMITATLKDLRIKKLASNRIANLGTSATGNPLTVTTSAISVASNGAVAGEPIVKGASSQRIGSFTLTANNTGAVNVTNISVNVDDNPDSVAVNGISNLRLMVDGQTIGNPTSQPVEDTASTFSVGGQLNIPQSQSKTVDVYADIASSTTMATIRVTIPTDGITGTASNVSITAPSSAVSLQTFTFAGSGTVALSAVTENINPRVLTAGETNVAVMAFQAKADNNEAMRLDKVLVTVNTSPSSVTGVTLMDKNGAIVAGPKALNGSTVEFAGLNQIIERNGQQNYMIAVNLTSSTAFDSTDDLSAELTSFEAYGQASGQLVTGSPAATGPTMLLENAYPVFAPNSGTTLAIGANQDIAKFTVTPQGNEAVNLKSLAINVSGGFDGTGLYGFKLYRRSGGTLSEVGNVTFTDNDGAIPSDGSGNKVTNGQTLTVTFTSPNGYEITTGTVADFVMQANTSTIKLATTEKTQLSLSIDGTNGINDAGNGVVYTYDTATADYATIGDQNALNEYPIRLSVLNN